MSKEIIVLPNQKETLLDLVSKETVKNKAEPKPQPEPSNETLTLKQEDWTRFLDPNGLAEKCGVPQNRFMQMALKELADNACDAGGATINAIDANSCIISDNGSGISLDAFDVKRPLVSSKHWRTGQRGALGNGLRAVMGAMYCLGGHLIVESRGTKHRVSVADNGETRLELLGYSKRQGTAITVNAVGAGGHAVNFAKTAINLQGGSVISAKKPSPHWFDRAAIIDLQRSAEGVKASEFVAQFGTNYRPYGGLITDYDPDELLDSMQMEALAEPKVKGLGKDTYSGSYYAKQPSEIGGVPCIIEVWATASKPSGDANVSASTLTIINRTNSLQGVEIDIEAKGRLKLTTGGYVYVLPSKERDKFTLKRSVDFFFIVAISAPFVPILSSGKAPDLDEIAVPIIKTVHKAGKNAQASITRRKSGTSIADAVNLLLPEAYNLVSDGGVYWANARQLMYAMRPDILRMCGVDQFSDSYITQVCLPKFQQENEAICANWKIAYDKRGSIIEPHTRTNVGLGTVEVDGYTKSTSSFVFDRQVSRVGLLDTLDPQHRFQGLLFCEKEGFTQLITDSGILERCDIALASTKGMSVIAARQLIDHMAGLVDGFTVYTLTDFDITGHGIRHTLTSSSDRYTFSNDINVVELGINWEQAQELHNSGRSEPVAGNQAKHRDLLLYRGLEAEAATFLCGNEPRRVEINAMPSAEIVDLLSSIPANKMVPPEDVLVEAYQELWVKEQTAQFEKRLRQKSRPTVPTNLVEKIKAQFESNPHQSWDEAILSLLKK